MFYLYFGYGKYPIYTLAMVSISIYLMLWLPKLELSDKDTSLLIEYHHIEELKKSASVLTQKEYLEPNSFPIIGG